jgi:hypothetical protein
LRQADSTFSAQSRDVLEHAIGSIRGLDRKHTAIGNHHCLSHIEPADRGNQCQPTLDIGEIAGGRPVNAERACANENLGDKIVRRDNPKLMRFENARQAGQEVIIAAPEHAYDFGQEQHRGPVKSKVTKRRAHDIADQDDVPATFGPGEPAKAPVLAQIQPMVWKERYSARVGKAMERKQNDSATAATDSIGNGKRQASAAADNRKRPLFRARIRINLLH